MSVVSPEAAPPTAATRAVAVPAAAEAAATPDAALRSVSVMATPLGVFTPILDLFGSPGVPRPVQLPTFSLVLEGVRRNLENSKRTSPTAAQIQSSSVITTVNVKDYGAVGDGLTDDSSAIKAAESALTSGGRLYFPEGDYRFAQQSPAGNAAILLDGLSDVTVEFAPGARLSMDNLDANGFGTSHGIRVVGAASNVTLLNPTIEWTTRPSARSFGDGISVLGWPSDSAPPVGWTGSTGEVQNVTITNARVVNSPQAGVVVMGASDVTVSNLTVIGSLADGLHFNADRRVTVDGLYAENTGDDGLAFVTYYDASQPWTYGPADGPFNQSGLGEWNNSGSTATNITVTGGAAGGVRVQGGYDIDISSVTVSDKDFGIQVNSSIATGPGDWMSLASRDISISNVTIDDTGTGIVLGTHNVAGTEDPMWWDFSGVAISDVTITNSDNWSIAVETPAAETSRFAGVTLRNIYAESNGNPTGGGNGGILLSSLQDSMIDNVKLVSDHAANINLFGASQIRSGTPVDELPSSNLTVNELELHGPGRILIQDIAGVTFGTVTSSNADGAAIELYRVSDATFDTITANLPGRGTGSGWGVRLLQVDGIDIADIEVTTDDHIGSSFWAVELGGGNPTGYIAGTDVHVANVTYVSNLDDMGSPIVVQGGPYGPVQWYINANWTYHGANSPSSGSALYGDISPL